MSQSAPRGKNVLGLGQNHHSRLLAFEGLEDRHLLNAAELLHSVDTDVPPLVVAGEADISAQVEATASSDTPDSGCVELSGGDSESAAVFVHDCNESSDPGEGEGEGEPVDFPSLGASPARFQSGGGSTLPVATPLPPIVVPTIPQVNNPITGPEPLPNVLPGSAISITPAAKLLPAPYPSFGVFVDATGSSLATESDAESNTALNIAPVSVPGISATQTDDDAHVRNVAADRFFFDLESEHRMDHETTTVAEAASTNRSAGNVRTQSPGNASSLEVVSLADFSDLPLQALTDEAAVSGESQDDALQEWLDETQTTEGGTKATRTSYSPWTVGLALTAIAGELGRRRWVRKQLDLSAHDDDWLWFHPKVENLE